LFPEGKKSSKIYSPGMPKTQKLADGERSVTNYDYAYLCLIMYGGGKTIHSKATKKDLREASHQC
jgi:hypothetical protein